MELVDVRRIWDRASHNAFTDLIRFHDQWYCVFREGRSHVCPRGTDNGKIRVIRSSDGLEWSSVALLNWEGGDLRDAKLSVTAEGQLMLNGAVAFYPQAEDKPRRSLTWLSADGEEFNGPFECPTGVNTWRWSVTWHNGTAYSLAYSGKDQQGCLYRSKDGKAWEATAKEVFSETEYCASETSLVFSENGTAYCLLRRDDGRGAAGLLGTSRPPYSDWEWKNIGVRIGGPKMLLLPDGRRLAAVRLYGEGGARTSLGWIDRKTDRFREALKLPSGGDTSYAGMVLHEEVLWVSYYSSHKEKTAIYLARVRLHKPEPCGQ